MAKKAAALQSFQKCDVQTLAIPSTIVEDTEVLGQDGSTDQSLANDRQRFVFIESENEVERGLHEPSDRIELAVSPVSLTPHTSTE